MSRPRQLLVADDDRAMRELLSSLFKERGLSVEDAPTADAALARAAELDFDVVLSDVGMPGLSGVALVGQLQRLRPRTPVVLMTASGSLEAAVEAMRSGAFDYLTKPFEPDAVILAVERALEHRALAEENAQLRRALDRAASLGELIGKSPAWRGIIAQIERIANSRSSVLITGESGTGKEVVARAIHFHGERSEKPFVPIPCSALPEGLLEAELFGHVRDAFPGAHASKRGLFEEADGGTLFLDEIGGMGLGLQGKLLRALEERQIRPLGGTQPVHVDVRVISATARDLEAEIAAGRFREDLFTRLSATSLHIPPLRERPEDIPLLVEAFLRRHADGRRRFLAPAMERLRAHPWRGNVRELENVIERALALSDAETLAPDDVPLPDVESDSPEPDGEDFLCAAAARGMTLRELDELYTERVLARTGGNKVQAARILGIDRKTLYRRAARGEVRGNAASREGREGR